MRLDVYREGEPVLGDARRFAGGDFGLPVERLPLVAQQQPVGLGTGVVFALLLQRVLDLEQVGEVARRRDPHVEVDGLVVVVEDGQPFPEPLPHHALADHRELRVDIHRSGTGYQEEPALVVLQVVG